mmetsp:Transcript_26950/g.58887  ORF Transcript_26950/g.58887 Transcript_26950/m.58887 type:complete len:275 (-) Transcript_26950:854-1678(-)|eukprot:CAMPEP_0202907184 /NCGR_PEP_ID=MMETSP1392-20130828/41641_1 /ASSEMBLY_ACC=CAM_ASM_000868 /TAXON_ID=225041 /ORGANISM="Chlamydomonas chlamydogama, Strain SAG 11-48b" /LENGTH=274 /DNA_ID=CAMNT_0049595981 /DNA_START=99 /DNA_END=923 /DNA_ORIENTATION=-
MAHSVLLFCALVLASAWQAAAVADDELRFPWLAGNGTRNQWNVSIFVGDKTLPGNGWTRVQCRTPELDACFNSDNPLPMQPLVGLGSGLVRIGYVYRNATKPFKVFQADQVPEKIEFRLCYSNIAFADRAWRKKNKPYPRLSQNCPFYLGDIPFPTGANYTTGSVSMMNGNWTYDMSGADSVTTATVFAMMWVRCTDGTVCAFESTESATNATTGDYLLPYNGNYVQTEVYDAVSSSMTASAIVLSVFSPVFLIAFWIFDHFYYKKTGKAFIFC